MTIAQQAIAYFFIDYMFILDFRGSYFSAVRFPSDGFDLYGLYF
jgi:hypothetical protein